MANEVEDGTYDTLPDISYKGAINEIQNINDIIYHNILIKKTFLPPQGEDGKFIHAQVKARAAQFDQDQEMFLFIFGEGQSTGIMTYYSIIKRLDILTLEQV